MRSNKPNPNNTVIVIDLYDQTMRIAFDVKNYSVVMKKTRRWIVPLNVPGSFPSGLLGLFEPTFELFLAIRMFGPIGFQCASCNNSHCANIVKVPFLGIYGFVFYSMYMLYDRWSKVFAIRYLRMVNLFFDPCSSFSINAAGNKNPKSTFQRTGI
jgi:hypothetical protein